MNYYITFNDVPSGIYQSQVIDVINTLNGLSDIKFKLIAFIPYQNFSKHKKEIKKQLPTAKVLPIIAGISRWELNEKVLKLITNRNSKAICRGPLATSLALKCGFSKVVYDGRAAVKAEVTEFDITGSEALNKDLIEAEKQAVLMSDYRIAVSQKLVEYWEKEFGYSGKYYVMIPCTLTSQALGVNLIKVQGESVKLVYSGGIGPWQSFELVVKLIKDLLNRQENVHVLFLTKENEAVNELIKIYPERCERKWLSHDSVFQELAACDYGILIRDQKITNQVASPVKFAEYLNAGLKVLISENLGDFSEFVKKNDCGEVIRDFIPDLKNVSQEQKSRLNQLGASYLSKDSVEIKQLYQVLLDL